MSLIRAYEEQNIQRIYKRTKKSLGKYRQLLLNNRNELMTKGIESMLNVGSFYTIGAAHLGGNRGVIALLKRKGIKIKPISI